MIWDMMDCVLRGRLSLTALAGGLGGPTVQPLGLPGRAVYEPAIQLDLQRMLAFMAPFVAAGTAENWTEVRAPTLEVTNKLSLRGLTRLHSAILLPSLDRAVQIHFRLIGERRLTATVIAMRLYELDHGRRPETLDALVPEYLAAVPRDPFHLGGGPIGYLRDDEAPRLYCAGTNGIDENGLLVWSSPTRLDHESSDYPVVFLDGRPPQEWADVFAEQRVLKIGPPAPPGAERGGEESADTNGEQPE